MDIHNKLKDLMKKRGWSEYRLSKNCGLSESTLANIFKRNTIPSISTLQTICDAFGITLSQFFAENEMVELTPELENLFNNFSTLTPKQKNIIISIIEQFNNEK